MEQQLQPGDVVLGRLRVIRVLGAGGLGAVYEVEHELTKHRRALKLLHPRFRTDREVVSRFLREASAAGRIGNPHIVEAFDAGETAEGEPYLVMEMLSGQPLSSLFRDQGRLDPGLACDLVAQAAGALHAAHRAGIVHRDVKPDNLFVTQRDGRPFVKVLDFGISKFDSQQTGAMTVTSAGTAMGTPLYMAPEQMRGAHEVDARADVYALGVVLYEALSGGVPYFAESFAELAALVLGGKSTPLASVRPELPLALSNLVHQAFAPLPAARFPSAEALADALHPFRGAALALPGSAPQTSDTIVRRVDSPATPVGMTGTQPRVDAGPAPMTPAPQAQDAANQRATPLPVPPLPGRAVPRWVIVLSAFVVLAGGVVWMDHRSDSSPPSEVPVAAPVQASPPALPVPAPPLEASAGLLPPLDAGAAAAPSGPPLVSGASKPLRKRSAGGSDAGQKPEALREEKLIETY